MNTKKTNIHTTKTILDYVLDTNRYINDNECNNYSPPFLTYIPTGVSYRNIDIENSLRNSNIQNTRCPENKTNSFCFDIPQKKECSNDFSITNKYVIKK